MMLAQQDNTGERLRSKSDVRQAIQKGAKTEFAELIGPMQKPMQELDTNALACM
jgi:hypothetical protein